MSHTVCCDIPGCDWRANGMSRDFVGCAATWHLFESHPVTWASLFGDRPPHDPDPRTGAGLAAILARDGEYE